MHWAELATYYTRDTIKEEKWISDHINSARHTFTKVPIPENAKRNDWHNRKSRRSTSSEWGTYWKQTGTAWKGDYDGYITVFPQLPLLLGLRKKFSSSNKPIISWCFNLGEKFSKPKLQLAKIGLSQVDKFIVHTRREIDIYSDWFSIPSDRFEFFPMQRGKIKITEKENIEQPFLLSMGSALRDYKTFFEAVKILNIKTKVVAAPRAVEGLDVPDNVQLISGITLDDCRILSQQARANVIPMIDRELPAGIVTIIEAMRIGRPLIVTKCLGSEDYVIDNQTGMFVEPYSVDSMINAITELWDNKEKREFMAKAAAAYADEHLSDNAASAKLESVLDSFL